MIDGRKPKYPFEVSLKSGKPLAFAALWERNAKGSDPPETVTILTKDANSLMSGVHDRMPAMPSSRAIDVWLDPKAEARPS